MRSRGATHVRLLVATGLLLLGGTRLEAAPTLKVAPALEVRTDGRFLLDVVLENDGRAREGRLTLETHEQMPTTIVPVELAPHSRKRLTVSHVDSYAREIVVTWSDQTSETVEAHVHQPSAYELVTAVLGRTPPDLRHDRIADHHFVVKLEPDRLPELGAAWPRLDSLVWSAPRVDDLTPIQRDALIDWVRSGGRLVAGRAEDQPDALKELGLDVLLGTDGAGLGEVTVLPVDLGRSREHGDVLLPSLNPKQSYYRRHQLPAAFGSRLIGVVPTGSLRGLWVGAILFGHVIALALLAFKTADLRKSGQTKEGWRSLVLPSLITVPAVLVLGLGTLRPAHVERVDLIELDDAGVPRRAMTYVLTFSPHATEWALSLDEALNVRFETEYRQRWAFQPGLELTGQPDRSGRRVGAWSRSAPRQAQLIRIDWIPDPSLASEAARCFEEGPVVRHASDQVGDSESVRSFRRLRGRRAARAGDWLPFLASITRRQQ
ncbi:MAG: hypothetical protein AAF533_26995, partial [Acidobacteriota bacterium]